MGLCCRSAYQQAFPQSRYEKRASDWDCMYPHPLTSAIPYSLPFLVRAPCNALTQTNMGSLQGWYVKNGAESSRQREVYVPRNGEFSNPLGRKRENLVLWRLTAKRLSPTLSISLTLLHPPSGWVGDFATTPQRDGWSITPCHPEPCLGCFFDSHLHIGIYKAKTGTEEAANNLGGGSRFSGKDWVSQLSEDCS